MISVLMSVYKKECPEYFDLAISSIYNQTFKDFEFVLVIDGSLTDDLYQILHKWENLFGKRMKTVYLKENKGLANALNEGLHHCSFDLVARMDSDDYSQPKRFELQYNFMKEHPEIDVLGSYVEEFLDNKNDITLIKEVPLIHQDIVNTMWFKNPINHVTVMFRKKSVIEVKNYESIYGDDDYLWAKMFIAGKKFYNMPTCLVKVRVSDVTYQRRGGMELFLKDFRVKKYLFDNGKMNFFQFLFVIFSFLLFRMAPLTVRKKLYFKIRKRKNL